MLCVAVVSEGGKQKAKLKWPKIHCFIFNMAMKLEYECATGVLFDDDTYMNGFLGQHISDKYCITYIKSVKTKKKLSI